MLKKVCSIVDVCNLEVLNKKIPQTSLVLMFFTCFDGIIQSESQDKFEEKRCNENMSSSAVTSRLIPRGAVESLTISA